MNKQSNPQKNRRVMNRFMILLTGILFVVFVFRFSYIMLAEEVNGENLSEQVQQLYTRSSTLAANRGTIYDVGGNPVAMDATSYSLVAILTDEWSQDEDDPNYVTDKEKTAEVLAKYISMSEEDIYAILDQDDVKQVEFGTAGTNLDYDTKLSIEEEGLPGITFTEEKTRLYPNGTYASHLIGYADTTTDSETEDSNSLTAKLQGVMGIEKAYDDLLNGTDGKVTYEEDFDGYTIPGTDTVVEEPTDGDDLYLTLDSRLQVYMESLLTQVYEEAEPESMVAMLINPKTGAILAASQRPTFNSTSKEGIDGEWRDLLVEDAYEPGSTFKILTLAAAVNEGIFSPFATYESGSITVDGVSIHDYNYYGWGTISYLEGFARSSNVAFVKLVQEMGYDVWEKYMLAFGITTPADSGLENEASGSYNFTYPLEKANTAFGQGVTVTPFQLLQAFTAIANGGQMMKLQYIYKTVDAETGKETYMEPEAVGTPITEETADLVLDYLTEVVYEDYGTAQPYAIDNATIGAKTGTAQLVDPETGMYYTGSNEYLYSVVGFAPIEDPSYILYVTLKLPKNTEEKSVADYLSSVFNPLLTRAVSYDSLDTESETSAEAANTLEIPKVTSMTKEEATTALTEAGFTNVAIVGTGNRIVQQNPYEATVSLASQKVVLMTEGAMTMPDVTGWSKDDILKVAEMTGVSFSFEGEGFAVSQSVAAGNMLESATKVTIELSNEQ